MINVKEKRKSKFLEKLLNCRFGLLVRVLEKQNQGIRFLERIDSHDTRGCRIL